MTFVISESDIICSTIKQDQPRNILFFEQIIIFFKYSGKFECTILSDQANLTYTEKLKCDAQMCLQIVFFHSFQPNLS